MGDGRCGARHAAAAMPALDAKLTAALAEAGRRMAAARDSWWIIGSAAAVLHAAPTEAADVDILTSARTAEAVLRAAGVRARQGGGSELFRSEVFGRIDAAPLPLEVMGGLALRAGKDWEPVVIESR